MNAPTLQFTYQGLFVLPKSVLFVQMFLINVHSPLSNDDVMYSICLLFFFWSTTTSKCKQPYQHLHTSHIHRKNHCVQTCELIGFIARCSIPTRFTIKHCITERMMSKITQPHIVQITLTTNNHLKRITHINHRIAQTPNPISRQLALLTIPKYQSRINHIHLDL